MTMSMVFSNNSTRFSQITSPTPAPDTTAHPQTSSPSGMMQNIIASKPTGCGSCGGK